MLPLITVDRSLATPSSDRSSAATAGSRIADAHSNLTEVQNGLSTFAGTLTSVQNRMARVAAAGGLTVTATTIEDPGPTPSALEAWHVHAPDGDIYREGFDIMRAMLADVGVRTVLTGYGGDEVMGLGPAERPLRTLAQSDRALPPLTYDLLATELGIRSMCSHDGTGTGP